MFRAFSRSLSCLQSALETECVTKNRTSEYQRKTRLKIPNIPTYFQCGQASRKELSSALKLNILIKTEKQMEKNPWLSPWFLAIKQGCSDDLGGTYCNCLALKCSIYFRLVHNTVHKKLNTNYDSFLDFCIGKIIHIFLEIYIAGPLINNS